MAAVYCVSLVEKKQGLTSVSGEECRCLSQSSYKWLLKGAVLKKFFPSCLLGPKTVCWEHPSLHGGHSRR